LGSGQEGEDVGFGDAVAGGGDAGEVDAGAAGEDLGFEGRRWAGRAVPGGRRGGGDGHWRWLAQGMGRTPAGHLRVTEWMLAQQGDGLEDGHFVAGGDQRRQKAGGGRFNLEDALGRFRRSNDLTCAHRLSCGLDPLGQRGKGVIG
jgi:hypothetical protein